MSRASVRYGKEAETMVVNFLRDEGWPDARRFLAGDGRQPGDIDGVPGVVIEVMRRKKSSWPTWCRQAEAEAGGRPWIVVRRELGNRDVGSWPARFTDPTLGGEAICAGTFSSALVVLDDLYADRVGHA